MIKQILRNCVLLPNQEENLKIILKSLNSILSFDFKFIDFETEDVLTFHKCFEKKPKRFTGPFS